MLEEFVWAPCSEEPGLDPYKTEQAILGVYIHNISWCYMKYLINTQVETFWEPLVSPYIFP